MKAPDQIGADVEAGMWTGHWAGTESPLAGDAPLAQLYALLDKPWFCRRHNVLFDLRERGQEHVIHISKGGVPAATWTAQGHTLVFRPAGAGPQERAETLDCAISITCDFLDHFKVRPAARAASAQPVGAL